MRLVTGSRRKRRDHTARLIDPIELLSEPRLKPTMPTLHVRDGRLHTPGPPGDRSQRQPTPCPQPTQYRTELSIA